MLNKKINNIKKRNAKERRFKAYGQLAIFFVLVFLVMLFSLIFYRASKALNRYELALEIDLTSYEKETDLREINFGKIIKNSLKTKFSEVKNLKEENWLYQILSRVADFELKNQIKNNRNLLGQKNIFWLPLSSKAEMYFKYKNSSNINEWQLQRLVNFENEKQIRRVFNRQFFYQADSREPEIAGIGAGLVGSLMVMFIFLILAFPIAVSCAFYLEEFAKKIVLPISLKLASTI
jgi:phosphate transport system permease protein